MIRSIIVSVASVATFSRAHTSTLPQRNIMSIETLKAALIGRSVVVDASDTYILTRAKHVRKSQYPDQN